MRLQIVSDLHLEFGGDGISDAGADLLIVAGDLHTKLNGVRWLLEHWRRCPAIYVCGNHEFYGARLPRLIDKMKAEAVGSDITVLENEFADLGGYRFFGGTLWTDMALFGDQFVGSALAMEKMNDYKRIRNSKDYRKLKASDTRSQHARFIAALGKAAEGAAHGRLVVVSHHAPSLLSLPERRRDQLLSCAYASALDELVLDLEPLLWIHGHIHHSRDYRIGKTRVLANPRAYPGEENPMFDPTLCVCL